ncbi:MAG: hypothetical protein ABFS24_04415 [Pseudomonadota bacterium]
MRRTSVTLLVAILLMLTGCPDIEPPDPVLDRLLIVFQGHHSKRQIQSKLDQAFRLYGVPITEENYTRYGSILVSLRRNVDSSATEMEILDYATRAYTPEVKLEEMMYMSSLILQSGAAVNLQPDVMNGKF